MYEDLQSTIKIFLQEGKKVEAQFAEDLSMCSGGIIKPATPEQDMYDHIDMFWNIKDKVYSFDVKAAKKEDRKNQSVSYSKTWLELMNVNGEPGSLYGKQDYMVFEMETEWLIVSRRQLLNKVLDNIIEKDKLYLQNPHKDYVQYRRPNRKDVIVRVPVSFLYENKKQIIPKRTK